MPTTHGEEQKDVWDRPEYRRIITVGGTEGIAPRLAVTVIISPGPENPLPGRVSIQLTVEEALELSARLELQALAELRRRGEDHTHCQIEDAMDRAKKEAMR